VQQPPVVLVHGFASSSEHGWRATGWVDLLQEAGRRVITVDLPGHGAARRSHDPDDYANAAEEVAGAFEGDAPVDAVGFSAGAHILAECAVRSPSLFRRLALLGVGLDLMRPRADATDELAEAVLTVDAVDPRARVFRAIAESAGNDPATLSAFLRRPVHTLTSRDLALVSCPVLIVVGDRDPAGPADELVDAFPDARLQRIRGADHFSTQGDVRVMDAVLGFLAG
jgi:pimeloyl-ACP methyl ester carboxylesterase